MNALYMVLTCRFALIWTKLAGKKRKKTPGFGKSSTFFTFSASRPFAVAFFTGAV
jgi:hypothetical protein